MLTLIGQQLFVFGLPVAALGLLYILNRESWPVMGRWGGDLWILPLLFSLSLIGLNGLPPMPPVETLHALVFLAPFTLFLIHLKGFWAIALLATLFNLGLFFVYYPLVGEAPLWISLQWVGANILFVAGHFLMQRTKGLLGALFWVLAGGVLAVFIFSNGSIVLGQAMGWACIPFGMLFLFQVFNKTQVSPARYQFFGLVVPLLLLAEALNYNF